MAGKTQINSNFEKLLGLLSVHHSDKLILIKETDLADSNFVLTHFIRKILDNEKNKICFVLMHNTIGHYQNVEKKMGMDLMKKLDSGHIVLLDLLTSVFNNLVFAKRKFSDRINEDFAKHIYNEITGKIDTLKSSPTTEQVYVIIEDLSKILDFGLDLSNCNVFLNHLINIATAGDIILIINTHIGGIDDGLLANSVEYSADMTIDVNALKTGKSTDVTGILKIKRHEEDAEELTYHYKAVDKEVKPFRPGEIFY